MAMQRTLETRRDAFDQLRVVDDPLPETLQTGQILLEVDRFALTANNISYCQVGDLLGYWRFFPTQDAQWGRVPAMGYATVSKSAHPEIKVGERVWGFFPMSTHLLIKGGKISAHNFCDVSEHRDGFAPIYAQFQRAASNPIYEASREEQDSLLRGLYLTSWLCEDALFDHDCYGAKDCLITSASSKTAIALAHAVKARGAMRSVGLTSARNKAFCEQLGCYDAVFSYDEISALPNEIPAVSVDMAGDRAVNAALHTHYGDQLRYAYLVGATHQDGPMGAGDKLPGPQPELFFAPAQAAKRSEEWGPSEMEKRIGSSFVDFRRFADQWLKIRHFDGALAAQEAFLMVLQGGASPAEGYTVSLGED
jgi:NADPH:quinone reductase-like Zn-dependent oxidoreductase